MKEKGMLNTLPFADPAKKRLGYLDNLRSLVIFLVVVMHSNVTYSGIGSWYYTEGNAASLDMVSRILFALYGSFTQAWFMGILFFLAAFFAARSLAKRGPAAFVRERLFRLGVPLLIYMFVIDPFIRYFIMNYGNIREHSNVLRFYLDYLASFRWIGSTGPLWFVEALLVFSLPYAAWRAIRPSAKTAGDSPKVMTVILIVMVTGLAAFSIRLFQPIGTSVANLQLCYFASYIALFLLGLYAGERRWLENFPEKQGLTWFTVVLGAGLVLWLAIVVASGAARGELLLTGGLNWQSFVYAYWEAFVAIGFSLGLIAFFRKYLNVQNRFTKLLAANSFAIYMFHAPVLITLSLLVRPWHGAPLLKHVAVAPLAFAATLAFSFLILRRIPGLRAVLK
jgi:surface polysaccharide O-acyltransferase-like enzyme